MNTGKIIVAGLIGGIVTFMLGFLTFAFLLEDYFLANTGSAEGVEREDMLMIPVILGHLAWGLLLAYILGKFNHIDSFSKGTFSGAIIGFLGSCAVALMQYGTTNLVNLTGSLTNMLCLTIISGIVGGIIGWVYSTGIRDEVLKEFEASENIS
ncbi:MAG: hypothetical protein KJO04_10115 [Bacteroidia bacterium]|nr:hypothetical protein [Bacteroidia bacterium]